MLRTVVFNVFTLCLFYPGPDSVVIAGDDPVDRGELVFRAHCAGCHLAADLKKDLADRKDTPEELTARMKATMPPEAAGSLTEEQYRDVTAYMLATVAGTAGGADVAWEHFNGGPAATRYAPLEQIHAGNATDLRIAWRWSAAPFGPEPELRFVTSPLIVGRTLYTTAGSTRNVVALDATTGQILWMWRPQEGQRFADAPRKGSGKGLAWMESDTGPRVFTVTPGYFLVSLDANTGLPDPAFGVNGRVDLKQGLRPGPGRKDLDIGLSFPPLAVNGVVVVGAAHMQSFRPPSAANVKGDIRGYDAVSGRLLWTFHTIPARGEPGYETWEKGSAEYTGNAGVWAPMSADPELGLVYLPVEAATGDRYGGDRHGDNLYANSLVALDIQTGKKVWHYQIIHHGIWDWDNPAAPILADLPDGRRLVVQLTKQAFAYVFDRATGKPVWPIIERPVPASDVPGEKAAATQPFPTRPAPFDRQGFTVDDLIDLTPDLFAAALNVIKPYRLGPLFTPPSLEKAPDGTIGTLSLPSAGGGANWQGGAYDPESGLLYVPSTTNPSVLSVVNDPEKSSVRFIAGNIRAPLVEGLPLVKPPWGRITAIDLSSGDHLWWMANADTPRDVAEHPALQDVTLPRTGVASRSGLLVTRTLLFAGEGERGGPVFRAHDKGTGEIVARIPLPAPQAGQPVTYMVNGRQFIVMAIADGEKPGELIALALPEETVDP